MAAQNVIIQSPNQSDVLATENIPPPNALTVEDLTDMQVLGVRKREGAQYVRTTRMFKLKTLNLHVLIVQVLRPLKHFRRSLLWEM